MTWRAIADRPHPLVIRHENFQPRQPRGVGRLTAAASRVDSERGVIDVVELAVEQGLTIVHLSAQLL